MFRKYFWFSTPFLLAAYPIIFIYVTNVEQVSLDVIAGILAASLGLTVLLLYLVFLFALIGGILFAFFWPQRLRPINTSIDGFVLILCCSMWLHWLRNPVQCGLTRYRQYNHPERFRISDLPLKRSLIVLLKNRCRSAYLPGIYFISQASTQQRLFRLKLN